VGRPTGSADGPAVIRSGRGLAAVLVAAAVYRVALLVQYRDASPYFGMPVLDAAVYDGWAREIAAGRGLPPGAFYFAPGYAYALAFLYRWVAATPLAVLVAQAALGLLVLALVARLATHASGPRAGVLAAAVAALYAPLPFLELKLLSATLGVALLVTGVLGVVAAAARGGWWRWGAAGVVLGAASLVRPETLLLAPLLVVWIVVWARPSRWPAAAGAVAAVAVGWAIPVTPVAVHNVRAGAGASIISSQAAVTFYQSNNPRARGFYVYLLEEGLSGAPERQEADERAIAERARGRPLSRAEVSAYWVGRAVAFMRDQPGRFAWLLGQKALKLLSGYEYATEFSLPVERESVWLLRLPCIPFTLLLALAAPALLAGGAPRTAALLRLAIAANVAVVLLFYVASRYRLPAVPLLAVFAGGTLDRLPDALRTRPRRALGAAAALALAVVVFDREWDATGHHQEAAAYCATGAVWAARGAHARAVPAFRRAVAIEPTRYDCWYRLGASLRAVGQPTAAAAAFGAATQVEPALFDAYVARAEALEEAGDVAGARAAYAAAGRLRPAEPRVAAGLARLAAHAP
jgi:tetratricopeptide (TPR) repeat protein